MSPRAGCRGDCYLHAPVAVETGCSRAAPVAVETWRRGFRGDCCCAQLRLIQIMGHTRLKIEIEPQSQYEIDLNLNMRLRLNLGSRAPKARRGGAAQRPRRARAARGRLAVAGRAMSLCVGGGAWRREGLWWRSRSASRARTKGEGGVSTTRGVWRAGPCAVPRRRSMAPERG